MSSPRRVGVFGGTFDPPHTGHLVVAGEVYEKAKLDRLLFVPAGEPPHKSRSLTSPFIRGAMVEAAIRTDPRFQVCDAELQRPGPSYMVDTLAGLAETHPEWSLSLVIGADQVEQFDTWKNPTRITELAEIIALSRSGESAMVAEAIPSHRITWVDVTRIDISSTLIRDRIREGWSVRHMVPDPVLSIIESNELYRS